MKMKNKKKFAKEIVELACNGEGIAVNKHSGMVFRAIIFRVVIVCLITTIIAKRKEKNGQSQSTSKSQ